MIEVSTLFHDDLSGPVAEPGEELLADGVVGVAGGHGGRVEGHDVAVQARARLRLALQDTEGKKKGV